MSITLNGSSLTIEKLVAIARDNEKVELAPEALERIKVCRLMLEDKLARKEVRMKVSEIPDSFKIFTGISDESIHLAETYIVEGALTNKSYNDALHIAMATINNADVLASWNFKHIVNHRRINLYNSVNLKLGYKPLDIRTPNEVLSYEE